MFLYFHFVYFFLIKTEIFSYENLICPSHIACVGNSYRVVI